MAVEVPEMDGGWFEAIRAYCERTDATFWSEPLNAVSNGAFLIAAGLAARRALAASDRDGPALALSALVAVVGVGSFLFHTFANVATMLADVIPIAIFIYAYFLMAMRRFFGLSLAAAIGVTLAFAASSAGFGPALDAMTGRSTAVLSNGSIDYVPAVLALVGVGAGIAVRAGANGPLRQAGLSMLGLAGLFLLSLTVRTVDAALCPALPSGTHFLWHVLNAIVLYGLIAVAVRIRRNAGTP